MVLGVDLLFLSTTAVRAIIKRSLGPRPYLRACNERVPPRHRPRGLLRQTSHAPHLPGPHLPAGVPAAGLALPPLREVQQRALGTLPDSALDHHFAVACSELFDFRLYSNRDSNCEKSTCGKRNLYSDVVQAYCADGSMLLVHLCGTLDTRKSTVFMFFEWQLRMSVFLIIIFDFFGADSAPRPPLSSRQNKKISCVHAAGQLGTHQPAAAQPGNCAPLMVFAILRSHMARMAADRTVRRFIRPAAVLPWLSVLLGAFRSELQPGKTAEPSAGPAARALSNKKRVPLGSAFRWDAR